MLRRKTRTGLTMIGIIIGVMTIVGLVSVSEGLNREATSGLGLLQSITVLKESAMDPLFSGIPIDYMEEIENIPGVSVVSPEIVLLVNSIEDSELRPMQMFTTQIMGVDPNKYAQMRSSYFDNVIEGRGLLSSDRYSAVIGTRLADDYRKTLGDKISVNDIDFRIVGIYSFGSDMLDSLVIIPYEIARDISGMESDTVSMFSVETEDPGDANRVANRIEMRLDDVDAQTQQEFSEQIAGLLNTVRTVQMIVTSIAAIVGGIGVLNTMLTSVSERTKEIGIMKAVGWTDRDVMKVIIMESVLIGFAGGIIGIVLGIGVSLVISGFLFFNTFVSPSLALYALGFAVVLGLFGGFLPARKAAKLSPIEALRFE
jgi:putative ABC transport system permease protein